MKKLYIILSLLTFGVKQLYSQADLKLVGGISKSASSIHVGITLNITFNVQNIGAATAPNSRTGIYISPNTSISSGLLVRSISMESLAASASSNGIQCSFPIPYIIAGTGTYYIIVRVNDIATISESNYANNTDTVSIYIDASPWAAQNLPYPVILIHGLKSNDDIWNNLNDSVQKKYGWSFGGRMDFCLNQDGKLAKSNITNDYRDWTDTTTLHPDDFFTINFDVDTFGTPHNIDFQSNQSAIFKQGKAVRDAITHVLAVTGRDKVILVGHSMGGLAARHYLQNSNLWINPGSNHHVAKLFTIGTPHGGSNSTSFGLPSTFLPDMNSEAVRDLRTDYLTANTNGAYLFNGAEDSAYLNDLYYFYNVDINCNSTTGEWITGINQKILPPNVLYASAIGVGNNLWGNSSDGVVGVDQANIKNYLNVQADIFNMNQPQYSLISPPSSSLNPWWHTDLTKQFYAIAQGLDEANDNSNAYSISASQLYYGLINYQSGYLLQTDYDFYKISILSTGNLNIQVYGITSPVFKIEVRNSMNRSIYSTSSLGRSYINVSVPVIAGNYYIVLSGVPTNNSFYYPYAFKCTFNTTTTYCSSTTNLTAPSGTFTDGSGSSNYNNNSDCRWKIKPSGATKIVLNFSNFNLNNPGDTVYVYNGGTTTSPLLAKHTGNTTQANDTSTGGTMLIRFVTDSSNAAAGWTANYTATIVTPPCSSTTNLTSQSGSFSDGSGTSNYGNNANCSWLINPPGALSITLNFSAFVTQSVKDIVNVYDGIDENANLLGSYSGSTVPTSLTSTGGAMYVEFITDSITTAAGWDATYSSIIPISNSGNGNPTNAIVGYEYWYDNDTARNYVSTTAIKTYTLNANLPTQNLAQGLHSIHVRFIDREGNWSSVLSEYFQKVAIDTGNYNKITAYEYWYDDAASNRNNTSITPIQTYNLNLGLATNNLNLGLHSLHVRFKGGNNVWSSVLSEYFQKVSLDTGDYNKITRYEYWFDTAATSCYVSNVIPPIQTFMLDTGLNTYNISKGQHILHTRFGAGNGLWSSVTTDTFNKKTLYLIDSIISPSCANDSLKIRFVKYTNYNTGNTFTVQLSDSSGLFTTPTAIGSKVNTTSGKDSILCFLLATLKYSTHYKLRVVCTNIADTTPVSNEFTINAAPTATLTPGGATSFCVGNSVTLNANTGTGLTYQWNNAGAAISGASNANYLASTSGSYTVLVTNSTGCKRLSSVTTVTVNPKPNVGFTINNTMQLLSGNSFVFNDTTSGTNTRLWNFGDATTNTIANPTKSYSSANIFSVKLRVTSSASCSDSITKNVTVLPNAPSSSATSLTFNNITATSMTLTWTNGNGQRRIVIAKAAGTVNSNPLNGTSYTANAAFGSGSQLGTGNFVIYKGTGNTVTVTGLSFFSQYYFAVVELNGDTTLSSYQTTPYLTGNQTTLPVKWLNFTAKLKDEKSVLLNWSTASEMNNSHFEVERATDNLEWSEIGKVKGNGTVSTMSSYLFYDSTFNADANLLIYRLKQVDFDGKFEYSKTAFLNLEKAQANQPLIVYPNPNEGIFIVEFSKNTQPKIIRIFDITGKLVIEMSTQDKKTTLNLETYGRGLYLINVKVGENYYNSKVLVK